MTGFAERPSGVLYDQAVDLARDQFGERESRYFDGLDNIVMTTVAVCGIPEVTRRFEADWEPFVQRIHAIDAPPARRVRGDGMLAATLGLRVVRGGMAA